MENTRAPHQNYRRDVRRSGDIRERQGQRILRRYHYGRVPDALLMAGLVVVGFVVLWYLGSLGLSLISGFFSMLGNLL